MRSTNRSTPLRIAGQRIEPDRVYDLHLDYSQSYTGMAISIPVRVVSGPRPGPVVGLVATIHGDEVNGIGILREVVFDNPIALRKGTMIIVPVVNVLGLESHSRYLPDRRDLNRCFPGSPKGSHSSRLAHLIFSEIIRHCDYGLDFHSAAVRRTNYPNVRADLDHPRTREIARLFGCELTVHSKGAEGSLRRVAVAHGIPTIVLEAGEVWKIEPGVVEVGARGIRNVLRHLAMIRGALEKPAWQIEVRRSVWVRAERGGILKFHTLPGDLVKKGQCLATNQNVLGQEQRQIKAPADGLILGLTTMPAVMPGEPVFHLAVVDKPYGQLKRLMTARSRSRLQHKRIQAQWATNILLKNRVTK